MFTGVVAWCAQWSTNVAGWFTSLRFFVISFKVMCNKTVSWSLLKWARYLLQTRTVQMYGIFLVDQPRKFETFIIKRRFFAENEIYDLFLAISLTVTKPSVDHYLTSLIETISFLRNWPKLKRHTQNVSKTTAELLVWYTAKWNNLKYIRCLFLFLFLNL